MKRVFTTSYDVAHLWANQTQDEARCRNTFFYNETIYSYGYHFPMGKIFGSTVLITTRSYSVTTSKHLREVESAASHLDAIFCRNVDVDKGLKWNNKNVHVDNLNAMYDNIVENAELLNRARADWKKNSYTASIATGVTNLRKYVDFMRCKGAMTVKVRRIYEMGLDAPELAAEAVEERLKQAAEQHKRDVAARQRMDKRKFNKWMRGEDVDMPWSYANEKTYLRVVERNGELVINTSKNSNIPIDEARRTFLFVNAIRERGDTWKRNGQTFNIDGRWNLDLVTSEGIKVGCHTVKWDEIERVAKQQAWI